MDVPVFSFTVKLYLKKYTGSIAISNRQALCLASGNSVSALEGFA